MADLLFIAALLVCLAGPHQILKTDEPAAKSGGGVGLSERAGEVGLDELRIFTL